MHLHRLLLAAALTLVGCAGASTITANDPDPCDRLADEMVDAVATMSTAIDAAYPGLALATVPTEPPPPAITDFKAEMQRIERGRRGQGCDPAQFNAALRERAHRIPGDGYMATTYRAGLQSGPYPLDAASEQGSAVVLPTGRGGHPPGPTVCTSRWCRFLLVSF